MRKHQGISKNLKIKLFEDIGGIPLITSILKAHNQIPIIIKKCMEFLSIYLSDEKHYPDSDDGLMQSKFCKQKKLSEYLGTVFVSKMIETFKL